MTKFPWCTERNKMLAVKLNDADIRCTSCRAVTEGEYKGWFRMGKYYTPHCPNSGGPRGGDWCTDKEKAKYKGDR